MRRVAPDKTLSFFIYAEGIEYSVFHTFRKKDSEARQDNPLLTKPSGVDQLFSLYYVFRIEPDATARSHSNPHHRQVHMATYRQPPYRAPVCLARHIHIALQHSLFVTNGSLDIHIHPRTMLNSGDPVDVSVWKSDGSILELRNCISLRYNFYGGWRNVKILSSGSAARYATAASSASTTLKYFFDIPLKMRNFAPWNHK